MGSSKIQAGVYENSGDRLISGGKLPGDQARLRRGLARAGDRLTSGAKMSRGSGEGQAKVGRSESDRLTPEGVTLSGSGDWQARSGNYEGDRMTLRIQVSRDSGDG